MSSVSRRTFLLSTGATLVLMTTHAFARRKSAGRALAVIAPRDPEVETEWRYHAGDQANARYAPLDQIHASNFNTLEVAWRFKADAPGSRKEDRFEATPLLVKGRLFLTVGARCIALDAATGEMLWTYRIDEGGHEQDAPHHRSGHGCSYWTDGASERVLFVTVGGRLVCLDAATGNPETSFGVDGIVDLKKDFAREIDPITGDVGLRAATLVVKDMIVVGAAHISGDVQGYVGAFDIRAGQRKWIFHTAPEKGRLGYNRWFGGDAAWVGNTGVWAQMSADEELGLFYLPVELSTDARMGVQGESLIALDMNTGKCRWHHWFAHHGLWDRDLSCAPILCDIPVAGKMVKALAQPSRQGWLYVLDRETGKPIWPFVERKVPGADVPGEWYSPTQLTPSKPPPYGRPGAGPETLINFTPEFHAEGLEPVKNHVTAPTLGKKGRSVGTLVAPGLHGGVDGPGGCYDPETCKLYVYSKTTPGPSTVQDLSPIAPPYGRITALDLTRGDITWQIAHGETPANIRNYPGLDGFEIPRTGREGNLGPLCTKSLVICGESGVSTNEYGIDGAMLRAYDKMTGEEMGAVHLPAPQNGSPMTYMLGGRQYLVVATGGDHYNGELVAFSLPTEA